MEPSHLTLPLATKNDLARISPAAVTAAAPGATTFSNVLKNVDKLTHHHHNSGNATSAASKNGTDAFGVESGSAKTETTDAFGVASATKSSNSSAISELSDPFTAISSSSQILAQLQQEPLNL
jgi:hypothetical protein